jgi:alanine-glyoxylate transaminase/serine-glyoxylate transaminase/serine-pyruvate transaminase
MHSDTPRFRPPRRLLMGPGPSDAHPRVLAALSQTTVGHMDPWFLGALNDLAERLRHVYQTKNELSLAVPGTGSAGMESMFNNLVEAGDAVLVASCGYFGDRMIEMAGRAGADLTVLRVPYGRIIEPEHIAAELKKKSFKLVALVHAETSTGAWQPMEDIAKMVRAHGALLVLDTVTSLGGVPVEIDAWGVDGAYSCSQKCLCCPPGLSPVTFSPRAVEAMAKRKTKPKGWYLDMTIIRQYWGTDRLYHHTAPANMIYALIEGLMMIQEEGLPARIERHRRNGNALAAGLSALGLRNLTQGGHALPQVHCVGIPEGIEEAKARKQLLEQFGIEIGGGLGEFKGKAWRIGLMGTNSRPATVVLFLEALQKVLADHGVKFAANAGVEAAEECLKDLVTAA